MRRNSCSPLSAQHGSVLIEAMVAILLFSVGVLAVAGLQTTMLQNTSVSRSRSEASYIAQKTIGRMWADPAATTAGGFNGSNAIPDLPNGVLSVTAPANLNVGMVVPNRFVVTVGWTEPGEAATIAADPLNGPCFLTVDVAHCFTMNATIP
jgi:type IV pilus assembly protein PilV